MSYANATEFAENMPMQALLGLPSEALDHAMAAAYGCYKVGRYTEAETLCKGLLAIDPSYWWAYSLYGAVLRNQGHLPEALAQIERGLKHEPGQPKLIAMKAETLRLISLCRKEVA